MTVTVTDLGNGTLDIEGCTVVDNGDGTLTITGATITDNGDGTLYIFGGAQPPPPPPPTSRSTVTSPGTLIKNPADEVYYYWNWAANLGQGETLTGATFTVSDPAVTLSLTTFDDTTATVFCVGGISGVDYELACAITTSGGRDLTRTVKVAVRNL